jgi:hypothetical protein
MRTDSRIDITDRGGPHVKPRLERLVGLAWVALGLTLVGCGAEADSDTLPRQAVSGTVTMDGKPLAHGRIEFQPASTEARVPAVGEIEDGSYSIPRGQGPTAGDYRVMITSAGANPGSDAPPGGAENVKVQAAAPDLIPKQYNAKTTLSAKVEADKSNSFDFPLKSAPPSPKRSR